MKQFFKFYFASFLGTLTVIGVFVLVGIITIIGLVAVAGKEKPVTVKANSVLKIDLDKPIPEQTKEDPFASFDFNTFKSNKAVGLTDLRECISKAKTDDNIKGIYLEMGIGSENGYATLEALRQALIDFRSSGKFVYAYGEMVSQKSYYTATAADQIFLNPNGLIELKGFGREITYYKNMLDKLGIEVQDFHCGAFKSAIEPFVRNNMSEPNRQQLSMIYNDVYSTFLNNIATARKIDTLQLNTIINNIAAETPEKDKELKLIDEAYYYDQVLDKMKEKVGIDKKKELSIIDASKYVNTLSDKNAGAPGRIAVVYAEGTIVDGEGQEDEVGGEKFAKIIRKLRTDEKVKAIVLRVNSPGGSALASDIMWRELVLARKEKPLIVSFGDVAASGGYYIACPGERIFAQPNTITGSIGVFGLVPNAKKFFNDKLGITFDEVEVTKHGVLGGITKPVEGEEAAFLQRNVERTYREFKQRVADGRGKDTAYIETIAQGRVWTGNQGLQNGLVDEIGGLDEAIAYAAKKANLKEYKLKSYPEEKSLAEKITESFADTKTNMIKEELGAEYEVYKTIKWLKNTKGVQAYMVYDLGL